VIPSVKSVISVVVYLVTLTTWVNAQVSLPLPERPLVFLPGIFGSKLCVDADPKRMVWGSLAAMPSFAELRLRLPGETSGPNILPCGEIDEFVIFGPLGQDVYKNFLDILENSGYVRNKTLFVFSYDWRLSNFDNAKKLESELERYVLQAGLPTDQKFDVLGHSMGGIIATIVANGESRRIDRLYTVATPYQGSVRLFASLESGWGWWQRRLISMEAVRRTVLSFPSIYELLPSYENCCALGQPGNRVVLNMLNPTDLQRIRWVRDSSSTDLEQQLSNARRLRTILDMPAKVPTIRLFGLQQETPEQIYLSAAPNSDPKRLINKLPTSWLGDGTVMAYSALGNLDTGRLPGIIPHDHIMSDIEIIKQLQRLLLLRTPVPPRKISGTPVATCNTSEGATYEIDGLSVDGKERLVAPGENVSLSLSVRMSSPIQQPESLRNIELRGQLEANNPTGTEIRFSPVGDVQFDRERSETGVVDFYSLKFNSFFVAPPSSGDARVRIRCYIGSE
jgi:pimeloyl-ACP methyl ester carboxylesterase